MALGKKQKARRPGASSWDKISAREVGETLAHRDVHGSQQLDREVLQPARGHRTARIAAAVAGLIVAGLVWGVYSVIAFAAAQVPATVGDLSVTGHDDAGQEYWVQEQAVTSGGRMVECFRPVDADGRRDVTGECFRRLADVPVPAWYQPPAPETSAATPRSDREPGAVTLAAHLVTPSWPKAATTGAAGLLVVWGFGAWLGRRVDAANLIRDTSDINQYTGDQHLALPEEIQRAYDWFPDAGAHSAVQASSLISHMMLTAKGLPAVPVSQRATATVLDEDGNVLVYEGEILQGDDGTPVTSRLPVIDERFGHALWDASGLPEDKTLRVAYDTGQIPYNPDGKQRGKLTGYETVRDLIRGDWELPAYEVQRPAGAYLVDTAPVNTMVLAITRAGKGQTFIEPTLDIWSREKLPSNMVVNDPKGELLVKFYVPFTRRGFEVVQFNLINSMKTAIYNPLGMAADAAREGDSTKCALYVENIADVFFPLDGGEDPVWPNAANNAFKRAAYGLIDFYLEEERELREHAAATGMAPETLEQRLDAMWGKVTLYNCYQLFVQLTSKKIVNPQVELDRRVKAGEFENDPDELDAERENAARQAFLWEGKAEQDMLNLYFNATEALPTNTMRTLIANANNALRAMAGAEKMLASVYGIAITAMSFFTDPTISTLTSGTPSQTTDLGGLSFPRRVGVRFAMSYLKRDHLIGQQAIWRAYADPGFTRDLGDDFAHSDIVSREGWARYYFKGVFPQDTAWIKLELKNPQTGMLIRTFFFQFRKGYQLSLNGRHYVTEPVTGAKVVKNGVLRELRPVTDDTDAQRDRFEPGDTTYPAQKLDLSVAGEPTRVTTRARAITQTMVRYSEAPKAVFLVTPPHLMKYAKLVLILVKQLVDLNFDKSYMTKKNQKPLYKTRFMLDELGNLQSEGHGIAGFETMLSIGLGQDQQFTIILQTLQQLREVYGDDVDRVVQGNTANIIFLKSTDDQMIEKLSKMSGIKHTTYRDSKQVTRDVHRLAFKTDGRVTYTMNTKDEPLVSFNDLEFLPAGNSIVYPAGNAVVWNRNQTTMPMSWRLLQDTITDPGHDYSLQTIPTLSSAIDFDVRRNQPDFRKMLAKRMGQAEHAADAREFYQQAWDYSDYDIELLDPDTYADDVMEIIGRMTRASLADQGADALDPDDLDPMMVLDEDAFIDNTEVQAEVRMRTAQAAQRARLLYAGGQISQDMLVNPDGSAKVCTLDLQIAGAYKIAGPDMERDRDHFSVDGAGNLRSADGTRPYLSITTSRQAARAFDELREAARKPEARVFADGTVSDQDVASLSSVRVHPEFYQFLASLPTWEHLARGEFDRAMSLAMRDDR